VYGRVRQKKVAGCGADRDKTFGAGKGEALRDARKRRVSLYGEGCTATKTTGESRDVGRVERIGGAPKPGPHSRPGDPLTRRHLSWKQSVVSEEPGAFTGGAPG
jgi:hypothetical protein